MFDTMGRFDVRVYGSWDGQLEGENGVFAVTVCNLGLGGAFIKGNLPSGQEGRLYLSDRRGKRINLRVRFLRKRPEGGAVAFLFNEPDQIVELWSFIREELSGKEFDLCPYCAGKLPSRLILRCPHCGHLLSFNRDDYLKQHLRETMTERLRLRLREVDGDLPLQLLPYIDRIISQREEREPEGCDEEFVGTCDAMLKVFSLIRKVAPTDVPVLILGETGTGKELTAKAIHERSPRKAKPFVVINCAAIPESLLEAELFGYEKGAFTGAYTSRVGKVEQADGGTLFLDEIGEMPPALQVKLLRFLEDGTVERIGSRQSRKVDVRVIAATNRDLEEEVEKGRFRQDLYYRLSVVTIELPPLRERGKDKEVLALYFLNRLQRDTPGPKKRFSREALEAIMRYPWPGNVREMINRIRKALLVSESTLITPEDLSLGEEATSQGVPPIKEAKHKVEKESLIRALEASDYNISRAARLLGVSRPTVYNLMRRYGIRTKGS